MSEGFPKRETALELSAPVKLQDHHKLDEFDCGEDSINEYLRDRARSAQRSRSAVVYVACFKDTDVVAGYYTLSSGAVARSDLPTAKLRQNMPGVTPATILGRMGLTKEAQGSGFAKELFRDALRRAIYASNEVASKVLVVHPLNDELAMWYAKLGFIHAPKLSPVTMILPLDY